MEENQQIINQSTDLTAFEKLKRSKIFYATIGAILLLVILTAIIFSVGPKLKNVKETQEQASSTQTGSGKISFLADAFSLNAPSGQKTVDVLIGSNTPLAGTFINFEYDPQFVEVNNFNLNNSNFSFFGNYVKIAQMNVDNTKGITTISLVLPDDIGEKTGKASIGALTFSIKNLTPKNYPTISISEKSYFVTRNGKSVKLTSQPLTIYY